jgi:dihydrofolate reductase
VLISLIAAMGENRVIGAGNALPWRLSADLRQFRKITIGKPVLMGRKTFESIGRPLPGRLNIVITRNPGFTAAGCTVVHSTEEAIKASAGFQEVMVIGGASFYEQFLPEAGRMYLTLVHARFEGDTFFPAFDWDDWKETRREDFVADVQTPYPYSFVVLERRVPTAA